MSVERSSGLLMHLTSLPSRYGIGDMGPGTTAFLDYLVECRQTWWQMLPIVPTGAGHSPYQSPSSFAGNPLLICPDLLVEMGLLEPRDIRPPVRFSEDEVEFERVAEFKDSVLRRAHAAFGRGDGAFQAFRDSQAHWLDDYALFTAQGERYGERSWCDWPIELAKRRKAALAGARKELASEIEFHCFVQFVFDRQWKALRAESEKRGVRLIGDVPIFVSHESADVWANPGLFELDVEGRPRVVAGVPPDYFCADGQLWGNPLYRWRAHARDEFAWWIARLRAQRNRFDLIRLDHFRGFEAYWEVSAKAKTAARGRWVAGPRDAFFKAVGQALGGLPFIAEDLGEITPPVLEMRDRFGLPGMKVLQFAFGSGPNNTYLPMRHVPNCVVYTGTHDNDTTRGWFESLPDTRTGERQYVLDYTGSKPDQMHWELIREALASVADLTIVPLQDVLGIGAEGRMNVPGRPTGNWAWRVRRRRLNAREPARKLARMTTTFGRAPMTDGK